MPLLIVAAAHALRRPAAGSEEPVIVTARGSTARVAGTLTVPDGKGPFPAVVVKRLPKR